MLLSAPLPLSILMLDGESDFALFVARCLGPVDGVKLSVLSSNRWAATRFSRYCHKFYHQPVVKENNQKLAIITKIVKQTGAQVLLPVDEPGVEFAARNTQALSQGAALVPLPNPDSFATLTNKWTLFEFQQQHHIPAPATIPYLPGSDFHTQLAGLHFPILIKPVHGRGGEGIYKFETPEALLAYLSPITAHPHPHHIVQTFITGYDIDCSILCLNGKILAYTIQQGIVKGSEDFAAPAGIMFTTNDQVKTVATQLAAAANWSGIAHLDMRLDTDTGQVKLLEVNARYWGSLMGSLLMGVNFPYLACQTALNRPFALPSYRTGRYIAPTAAIRQTLKHLKQRRQITFHFSETGWQYVIADPVAEIVKLNTP